MKSSFQRFLRKNPTTKRRGTEKNKGEIKPYKSKRIGKTTSILNNTLHQYLEIDQILFGEIKELCPTLTQRTVEKPMQKGGKNVLSL